MTHRNQSLDLLRGVAILLVVLVHCAIAASGSVPGLTAFAHEHGERGVQLFFMVSGYTMMLTFGDKVDPAAIRSFYIRRAFRIVPLFWAAILFYLVITKGEGFKFWAPDGIAASDVMLTLLFLHWSSVTAFNSVVPGGWSIAVEMQFYLLFPLLIFLFRRPNGPILVYTGIALISVIGKFAADVYLLPHLAASLPQDQAYLANGFFYCWLPQQLICFGFGILLYDFIELKNRPSFGAVLLAAASLSYSTWGAEVVLLAALACGILAANVRLAFVGLLGRHSYAIYLVHFALVSAITALWPMGLVPLFVLVTGASLGLSYFVIEPLIERRFNRLGHVLASPGRPPKAIATAA
ncbi:acyltransferase [Afipia sp. GAS231]|uniref:acyltransferase family protein n=1 Tax=Afipia sp. GAS231 TaxID=1882747 RepID=UPI00087CCF05|nr:acyltransferase [Afipia sp. GAS231]SDN91506.1 Peptidoglycan/LPS O-acetylase OafA/YrhL, contains acyltransferase and SGNH-hydrolase domains [Afipia sp. GAS231]